jgi:hypothetical protein
MIIKISNVTAFSMTIIGETYQINGTENNAYCRSHRPLTESDCYESACEPPACIEDHNYFNFKAFMDYSLGLRMFLPGDYYAPKVFICENV